MDKKFIITIDTEGDNMWRRLYTPNSIKRITNRNGEHIYKFQELCEKYKLIPTYLVNYEMSLSKPFVEMSQPKLKEKRLEIGMHMHAWNCPPIYKLKPGKREGDNPYIGEYPEKIIVQKVDYLTKQLEEVFQTEMLSHRSGRWYLNKVYLKILKEYGDIVDCSVTPGVDWRKGPGLTKNSKGSNYKQFYGKDYEISLEDLRREGKSGIYEVPVTTEIKRYHLIKNEVIWLRPNGSNLDKMCNLIKQRAKSNVDYVEFMLHSSELMAGGSPNFQTKESIQKLYYDLDILFSYATSIYSGSSLSDFVIKKYIKSRKK